MDPIKTVDERSLVYPLTLDVNMYDGAGAFFPAAWCTLVTQVIERHLMAIELDVPRLMRRFGVSWVLLSLSLQVYRTPRADEQLTARTWATNRQHSSFRRDIAFYDADGRMVAACATFSTLFDLTTRRVCTDRSIFEAIQLSDGQALLEASSRFTSGADFIEIEQRTARPSWQDALGHVHNSRYGEIVYDALSDEERKALKGLRRMDVWFMGELRPGTKFLVQKACEADAVTIRGVLCDNGRPSFAMRLTF